MHNGNFCSLLVAAYWLRHKYGRHKACTINEDVDQSTHIGVSLVAHVHNMRKKIFMIQ